MSQQTTAIMPFEPRDMAEADSLAKRLSNSNLLPVALRKKPEDVLVTLLTGRELGLSPMMAIRAIHVIEGRPVLSADMMIALCQRSPVCETFRCVESTDMKATYETKRKGQQPARLTFTIEQARAAGLTNKDNWKRYPAAMLRARCKSQLARDVYPDLLAGCYDQDETEELRRDVRAEVVVGASSTVEAPAAPAPADQIEDGVIEEIPATPEQSAPSPTDRLRAAIAVAATPDALRALVSEIKALPAEDQQALRGAYSARSAALNASATVSATGGEQ
jgi:hypothetical protein